MALHQMPSSSAQASAAAPRYKYQMKAEKRDPNEKVPIPTNKQLASLMKESVNTNYGQRPVHNKRVRLIDTGKIRNQKIGKSRA